MTEMCFVQQPHVELELKTDQVIKMNTLKLMKQLSRPYLILGVIRLPVLRRFVPSNIISIRETILICCVHGDGRSSDI